MEKIYMQDEQSFRKRSSLNVSVVLSFVIAAFAVVSLMAAGFSQISYALPEDTFTMFQEYHSSDSNIVQVKPKTGAVASTSYNVPIYKVNDNNGNSAYCIQRKVPTNTGVKYTKDKAIDDYGLLYLLDQAENGKLSVNLENMKVTGTAPYDKATFQRYVKTYIYQSAIWVYMNEKYSSDSNNAIDAADLTAITTTDNLYIVDGGSDVLTAYAHDVTVSGVANEINTLVSNAKNASGDRFLNVSFKTKDLSKTDDGNYYQSDEINVTTPNAASLTSTSFELSGIDGAFIVDADGNKVDANKGFQQGAKYYARIPADKVSETAQTLTLKVTGNFSKLAGYHYTAKDKQTVITVTGENLPVPATASLEVVGAPDTGMSVSQTIYFIGLIVLLCGVGIVYANAKPAEVK